MQTKSRCYLCREMSNSMHSLTLHQFQWGENHALQTSQQPGCNFRLQIQLGGHVNKLCQASYLQLYNISQVRNCLNKRYVKLSFMHSFPQNLILWMLFFMTSLTIYLRNCKKCRIMQHRCYVDYVSTTTYTLPAGTTLASHLKTNWISESSVVF